MDIHPTIRDEVGGGPLSRLVWFVFLCIDILAFL